MVDATGPRLCLTQEAGVQVWIGDLGRMRALVKQTEARLFKQPPFNDDHGEARGEGPVIRARRGGRLRGAAEQPAPAARGDKRFTNAYEIGWRLDMPAALAQANPA